MGNTNATTNTDTNSPPDTSVDSQELSVCSQTSVEVKVDSDFQVIDANGSICYEEKSSLQSEGSSLALSDSAMPLSFDDIAEHTPQVAENLTQVAPLSNLVARTTIYQDALPESATSFERTDSLAVCICLYFVYKFLSSFTFRPVKDTRIQLFLPVHPNPTIEDERCSYAPNEPTEDCDECASFNTDDVTHGPRGTNKTIEEDLDRVAAQMLHDLGIPVISTYADITNIALRYPEAASAILKMPLSASPLAVACALNLMALPTSPAKEYNNFTMDSFHPPVADKKSPAHTPERPNWALAPDEPTEVTQIHSEQLRPRAGKRAKNYRFIEQATPQSLIANDEMDPWCYTSDLSASLEPAEKISFPGGGEKHLNISCPKRSFLHEYPPHLDTNVVSTSTPPKIAAESVPNIIVNEFELGRSLSEWSADEAQTEGTKNICDPWGDSTIDVIRVVGAIEEEAADEWQHKPKLDSWLLPVERKGSPGQSQAGYLEVPKPAHTERRRRWNLDVDPYEDDSPSELYAFTSSGSQTPEKKSPPASHPISSTPPDRWTAKSTNDPHPLHVVSAVGGPSPPRKRSPLLEDAIKAIILEPQPSAAVPIRSPHDPPGRASPTDLAGRTPRVLSFFSNDERDEETHFRHKALGKIPEFSASSSPMAPHNDLLGQSYSHPGKGVSQVP
ncbi:hypothetical protein BDQ17DRAFT_294074 [Cyathus striatus]|nr:hypothetical protein BDQ17DRAFT_294074 [Cyathus striatus]